MLKDVTKRRCIKCYDKPLRVTGWFSWYDSKTGKGKNKPRNLPMKHYLRWEKPELNNFMLAPLAKSAGGLERCGRAVFKDKNDPDYQKLLHAFIRFMSGSISCLVWICWGPRRCEGRFI